MQLTAVRTLTSVLAAPSLAASVSGSTATLSWTPPVPTGQSVIGGYRVYKGATAGSQTTLVGTTTGTTLPDTLSGTQYYRVEAFDQFQTGNSSSPLGCVPQGNVFRFASVVGHYYRFNSYHFGDSNVPVATVQSRLNSIPSKVTGVVVSAYPHYIVDNVASGPDTYNAFFANMDAVLATATTAGKVVGLELADRVFATSDGTIPGNLAPTQWNTKGYTEAGTVGTGIQGCVKMWDVTTMNLAWIPMIQAILNRYKNNTAFGWLQIGGESTWAATPPGMDFTQYFRNLKTITAAARVAAPNTLIHVLLDYAQPAGFASDILNLQDQLNYYITLGGIMVAGPDPRLPGPVSTATKNPTVNRIYLNQLGGVDYRNKIIFRSQVEAPGQASTPTDQQNLWTLIKSGEDSQIMVWTDISSWSSLETLIQNGTISACRSTPPNDGFNYGDTPPAVTGLRISKQGDSSNGSLNPTNNVISMTWNPSAGATSYVVQRGINGAVKTDYAILGNVLTYTDIAATNAYSAQNIGEQGGSPTNGTGPTTVYDYDIIPVNANGRGAATADCQFWFYMNGVPYGVNAAADLSGPNTVNYSDTTLSPPTGTADMAVTMGGVGGYIQAPSYSPGTWIYGMECGAFNYMNLTCKPIDSSQQWLFSFHSRGTVGDIGGPHIVLNLLNYGPAPQAGVWATYKVPLSDLGFGVCTFTGSISGGVLTASNVSGCPMDSGGWISWAGQTIPTQIQSTPAQSGAGTYGVAGTTSQASIAMVYHRSNAYKWQVKSNTGGNGSVFGVTNVYMSRS